jgi:spermidine/putrescine transport system substrate-binding protein
MAKSHKTNPKQYLRRDVLRIGGGVALSTPFVGRAWAQTTELNMLAW